MGIARAIKKILSIDDKDRLFMNIRDKRVTTDILEEDKPRYCPPHRIPHSLPILGQSICDEPCHVHESRMRQYSHHEPFCLMLGCQNYEAMKKARKRLYSKQD